jgi:SulP family sulfate permease
LGSALKLGRFARFVSEPVLTGFTAAAGLYVAGNQLPALLGLEKKTMVHALWGWKPPSTFTFDLLRTLLSIGETKWASLAIGAGTFFLVRALQRAERRIGRRIPAPFVAIVAATLLTHVFGLGDPSMGIHRLSLVRDIHPLTRDFPVLIWPNSRYDDLSALFSTALAIAVLGSVEAIAIGKVLAVRRGHAFDSNRQLLAEGVANLGASLVGGFPSSGSFTRSAVNFESGAVTRLSGVFSGIIVFAIVVVFVPVANDIPIAALAGTLIHIGLKLVNVSKLRVAMQTTRSDLSVLLTTFLAGLFFEHLQNALFLGIAVSLVQAIRRAEGFKLALLIEDASGALLERPLLGPVCGTMLVVDLQGELFFAAKDELEARFLQMFQDGARVVVLRLAHAYNLDFTTVSALENVAQTAREKEGRLLLSGVRHGTYETLERAGLIALLGQDAVFESGSDVLGSTRRAIKYGREIVAQKPS